MDPTSLLSSFGGGGGGGGGGYGAGPTSLSSGGTNKAAFGSINFGAGAKVGGTSTAEGDAGTGQNQILLYVGFGVIALVALFVLIRR